jgi:hypothetical protein
VTPPMYTPQSPAPLKRHARALTAQHRGNDRARQRVRDLEHKVAGRARKVRVPARALAPVRVLAVVRADHLRAVRLAARAALVARAARVGLRADADAVADLDVLDGAADAQRDADDLVAHDLRVHRRTPPAAECVQVCTKKN